MSNYIQRLLNNENQRQFISSTGSFPRPTEDKEFSIEEALGKVKGMGKFQSVLLFTFIISHMLSVYIDLSLPFLVQPGPFLCEAINDPNAKPEPCQPSQECQSEFRMEVDTSNPEAIENWTNENQFWCRNNKFQLDAYRQYSLFVLIAGVFIMLPLSDATGRLYIYYAVLLVRTLLLGSFLALKVQYQFYVVLGLWDFLQPAHYILSFIYCLEFIKSRQFDFCAMGILVSPYIFGSLIVLYFYLSPSWRPLHIAAVVILCVLVLTYKFVPESPRHMLAQRKYLRAREIINYIGRMNSGQALDSLTSNRQIFTERLEGEEFYRTIYHLQKGRLWMEEFKAFLLKFKLLFNCLVFLVLFFVEGLNMNESYTNFQEFIDNNFSSQALSMVFSAIGVILCPFFLTRIGHRITLATCLLLMAVCNLQIIVQDFIQNQALTKYLLVPAHRILSSLCQAILYTLAFKYFPTRYRATMLGLFYLAEKLGGFLSMEIGGGQEEKVSSKLPIGIITAISFLMSLFISVQRRVIDYIPIKREREYSESRWQILGKTSGGQELSRMK